MWNGVKTAMLMAAIAALFVVIGGLIGGQRGMLLALLFALGTNFFAYWFSDSMVLRMYNAQPVDASNAPQFYRMVQELAQRAGLPMPRVYLIDEAAPNAFATGRSPEHAAVAATTGLLRMLSDREVRGVISHELAHVQHRDILISTVSATMAGAVSAMANFALFFGGRDEQGRPANPIAVDCGGAARAACSRVDPDGDLARSRIRSGPRRRANLRRPGSTRDGARKNPPLWGKRCRSIRAQAHPATAQMMIVNPLSGGGIANLFSTHPPVEERIARLMALAR